MHLNLPVLASIVAALATTAAAALGPPGVYKLDFELHRGSKANTAQLGAPGHFVKREVDGVVTLELANESTFYKANLKVGSRGETVGVLVDTGSSDLWIMGKDNNYCARGTVKRDAKNLVGLHRAALDADRDTEPLTGKASDVTQRAVRQGDFIDCSVYGTFDETKSTTFKSNNTAFAIRYADNTFATGGWGYDTVMIDDLTIANLSFAVASLSNSTMGVLGIGLPGLETTYSNAGRNTQPYMYENLPMKMKSDGLIKRNIYSLYLNASSSASGSVLFGGVDHSKYIGSLVTVPVLNTLSTLFKNPIKLEIALDSISFDGKSLLSTSSPALLDSGTTLSYLPSSVVSAIGSSLKLLYNLNVGAPTYLCSAGSDQTVAFKFSGATINVPLSSFFMPLTYTNGQISDVCVLGVMESNEIVLGDNFLRHAYIVYDLDGYEISLANANFGASSQDEDIVAVLSTIPGAESGASTGTAPVSSTRRSGVASTTGRSSQSSSTSSRTSDGGAARAVAVAGLPSMVSLFGAAVLMLI